MQLLNYYNNDKVKISKMIDLHKKFNKKIILASGLWTWNYPYSNYEKSIDIINSQLDVVNKLDIKEVVFTCWNDDGAYVSFDSIYSTLFGALFNPSNENDIKYFNYITKRDFHKDVNISKINLKNINPIGIVYDDLLMGIYLNNFSKVDIENEIYYLKKLNDMDDIEYSAIKNILILKLELRLSLLETNSKDKNFKKHIPKIKKLIKNYNIYLCCISNRWNKNYEDVGLEIHEYRIGGIIQRLHSIIEKINNNLSLNQLNEKPSKKDSLSIQFKHLTSSTIF